MKTLGKIVGGMMLAEGAAMVASPHAYLKIWAQRNMPEWVREQTEPWLKMPESTLRLLGADLILLAGLMLCLSREG